MDSRLLARLGVCHQEFLKNGVLTQTQDDPDVPDRGKYMIHGGTSHTALPKTLDPEAQTQWFLTPGNEYGYESRYKPYMGALDMFERHNISEVLDAGCGFGNFLAYHVARGGTGIGVDPRYHSVQVASEHLGSENMFLGTYEMLTEVFVDLHRQDPNLSFVQCISQFHHLHAPYLDPEMVKKFLAAGLCVSGWLCIPFPQDYQWLAELVQPVEEVMCAPLAYNYRQYLLKRRPGGVQVARRILGL